MQALKMQEKDQLSFAFFGRCMLILFVFGSPRLFLRAQLPPCFYQNHGTL